MATPLRQRGRAASHRFGVRMVAGMLAVSVPMMLVIAAVVTTEATHSLTSASERRGQSVAQAVTVHVEDWLSERQETSPLSPNVLQDGSATRPSRSWRRRSTRPTTISP